MLPNRPSLNTPLADLSRLLQPPPPLLLLPLLPRVAASAAASEVEAMAVVEVKHVGDVQGLAAGRHGLRAAAELRWPSCPLRVQHRAMPNRLVPDRKVRTHTLHGLSSRRVSLRPPFSLACFDLCCTPPIVADDNGGFQRWSDGSEFEGYGVSKRMSAWHLCVRVCLCTQSCACALHHVPQYFLRAHTREHEHALSPTGSPRR